MFCEDEQKVVRIRAERTIRHVYIVESMLRLFVQHFCQVVDVQQPSLFG